MGERSYLVGFATILERLRERAWVRATPARTTGLVWSGEGLVSHLKL